MTFHMSMAALGLILLPWIARAISPPSRSMNGAPLPSKWHAVIKDAAQWRHVIIVGDVHGCFDELQDLLSEVKFDGARDLLVLVGDLVNKGPKSPDVVRWARINGALCVRGNHDDALLSVIWRTGKWADTTPPLSYDYARALDCDDIRWMASLPLSLRLEGMGVLVVHAGVVPGKDLQEQTPLDMMKMRNVRAGPDGALEGLEKDADGALAWAKSYGGHLGHVVFGHDAKRGLQLEEHCTGLDTGCVYGKELTALVLPSRERVSVRARAVYEEPGKKKAYR